MCLEVHRADVDRPQLTLCGQEHYRHRVDRRQAAVHGDGREAVQGGAGGVVDHAGHQGEHTRPLSVVQLALCTDGAQSRPHLPMHTLDLTIALAGVRHHHVMVGVAQAPQLGQDFVAEVATTVSHPPLGVAEPCVPRQDGVDDHTGLRRARRHQLHEPAEAVLDGQDPPVVVAVRSCSGPHVGEVEPDLLPRCSCSDGVAERTRDAPTTTHLAAEQARADERGDVRCHVVPVEVLLQGAQGGVDAAVCRRARVGDDSQTQPKAQHIRDPHPLACRHPHTVTVQVGVGWDTVAPHCLALSCYDLLHQGAVVHVELQHIRGRGEQGRRCNR